ncbi:MAG: PQQ-binding-like beta-propeller repeat protein, partial [Halobacteriaceae archaeon]
DGAGSAPRPLAAVPGRVLVSVGVGVVALASATGAPRWRVDREFLNRAPVGAGRATVYVGAAAAEPDGNPGAVPVSAHDAETGARRWRLLLDGVAAVPQAAPRGAYVNTIRDQGRALYALRPGGTSWRVDGLELPGGAFAGDRLFAVAPGEAVVGVTAAGTEAWRHGLPTDLPGDHPLVVPVGGRPVVVAGATATALAPGDGATLWSYDAGAPVRSAVAGDGRAYLLTTDAVHALTLAGP